MKIESGKRYVLRNGLITGFSECIGNLDGAYECYVVSIPSDGGLWRTIVLTSYGYCMNDTNEYEADHEFVKG